MTQNQPLERQGQMLGRYRLQRMLGRGGMGEVWLATDEQIQRDVAIKLLPVVRANNQNYLRLFEYEARAAASLEHPNILPVHDFGEQTRENGELTTYLVMPYITGGTLRERMRQRQLSVQEALNYIKQAAQAIDYAHSRQVLHRDIKPANMLLDHSWLLLTDFGLAKLQSSTTYHTQTNAGAGTPVYMAPEQAQGHAEAASDQYSLVVIAYQLFCGQLPFQGQTSFDILVKQIHETPPAPRTINENIPQEVEDTLLRGLAKEPAQRFANCSEFAETLAQGWSRAIQTDFDPEATELAPWSRRLHTIPNTVPAPPPAEQVPNASTEPYIEQSTHVNSEHNTESPEHPPLFPPDPALSPHTPQPTSVASQATAQRYNESAGDVQPQPIEEKRKVNRRTFLIGGTTVAAAAVIGGGAYLATHLPHTPVAQKAVAGPRKLIAGVPLLVLESHSDIVWNAEWHPDGRYLATAGADERVMLWDIESSIKKSPHTIQGVHTPTSMWKFASQFTDGEICWSSDGKTLVASPGGEGKLYLIDAFHAAKSPQIFPPYTLNGTQSFDQPIYDQVAWQPGSNTFATADNPTLLQVKVDLWQPTNLATPTKSLTYSNAASGVTVGTLGWSKDGSMLAGYTSDAHIVVWNAKTGASLAYFSLNGLNLNLPHITSNQTINLIRTALAWSPTNTYMMAVPNADVAVVWDVRQKKPSMLLTTDDSYAFDYPKPNDIQWGPQIESLTWSPSGRYLAGCYSRDASIYIWDLQEKNPKMSNGYRLQTLFFPSKAGSIGHTSTITDIEWSPDGRYIASVSYDKTAIIWQVDGA
jgi:serine/threonine protein kinase/WD40 repeat protein